MTKLNQRGAQISTKGMIGMFESILVVFVVTIFIVIGIVIYASLQGNSSQRDAITELRASRVQHSALTMPEFTCEACGGSLRDNCFDTAKLDAFISLPSATKDKYYSYFGKSKLAVEQKYPQEMRWNLYDKSGEGRIRAYMPILLCNATQNTYNFGVLIIDVSPQ